MAKIHVADVEYFEELQNALDTLLAGYLREHLREFPESRPWNLKVLELAKWNNDRIEAAKREANRR